jgi:cysteine-rich repeat protein
MRPRRSFISALFAISLSLLATSGDAVATLCGDGFTDPPEQCDDGNVSTGDGCTQTCRLESGYCRTGNGGAAVISRDPSFGHCLSGTSCGAGQICSFATCAPPSCTCDPGPGWTCSSGCAGTCVAAPPPVRAPALDAGPRALLAAALLGIGVALARWKRSPRTLRTSPGRAGQSMDHQRRFVITRSRGHG